MTARRIFSGSAFETEFGYARAVVSGGWVFVSGTTGFDYASMTILPDVAAQTEQALQNIEAALGEAGCTLHDIVRVRYILQDRRDFPLCAPVLRRHFGAALPPGPCSDALHRRNLPAPPPAATMIEARLLDDRMKIEIEATAILPAQP